MSDRDRKRVLVSWSSGKDSAWMLHILQERSDIDLIGLLTTFNEAADRVAMHAVRRELVETQTDLVGLPLWAVPLPWPCSNAEYESRMAEAVGRALDDGVTHIAFGDLFLEDIRDYRIRQMDSMGIEPLFPLWCGPGETTDLAHQMIDAGLEAVITCVDPAQIDPSFVGRRFDRTLLADLPDGIDLCGERGEFHTFCFAGPHQRGELRVEVGETVRRDGFVFADVRRA